MTIEPPDVEVDQEADEKSKEVTTTITVEQEIAKRISVVVEADKTDDGDEEATVGLKISF